MRYFYSLYLMKNVSRNMIKNNEINFYFINNLLKTNEIETITITLHQDLLLVESGRLEMSFVYQRFEYLII